MFIKCGTPTNFVAARLLPGIKTKDAVDADEDDHHLEQRLDAKAVSWVAHDMRRQCGSALGCLVAVRFGLNDF